MRGPVRAFNLIISNIPGPQQPFYFNGQMMREVYPVVPPTRPEPFPAACATSSALR